MKPEQALQILFQASQAANMPAASHIQCQTAVEVLKKALEPKVEEKKPDLK